MYNWNFPLLLLFCVLNTIEADRSLVDGREYSRERSLRSYNPDIRSFSYRNERIPKDSSIIAIRKEYRDIPILQENRRESRTHIRTDQSRNINRGLSRYQINYDRLSFRQRQTDKNHYFRSVNNRVLSTERLDDTNERRTLYVLNNLRTKSDKRQMPDTNESVVNSFNEMRKVTNTREVRCETANSKNRMIRSSEDLRQDSRINREIEKRDSSNLLRNDRKINDPQHRANRQTINKDTRDEQRERTAPSVERQTKRVTSSRQAIRNDQSITRDIQRAIRLNKENNAVRREREIRNEHLKTYELRLHNKRYISRARDFASRSSERISFAKNEASKAISTMERDIKVRQNERNMREREKHRSSDVRRDVLRSLERMNLRDNTATTDGENVLRAAQDARRRQVRRNIIKTNIEDISYSYYRDSNNRNIVVRRETRKSHPNESNTRLNNNQRSSLRETERNIVRHTRESERISNSMDRDVRLNERNSELRLRSINRRDRTRSAGRFREFTEKPRENTERNSLRRQDDRTSDRRQQRTGYANSIKRTSFDERQIRRSNSKGEIDHNTNNRQNLNRNVVRTTTVLTTENSANGRIGQLVIRRQVRESGLIQHFEKNKRIREYDLNFEHSRNTLSKMAYEEISLINWQAAFYALQAIYICSIAFKIWNRTDSTKRKTWSFSWLSVPVNKID